MKTIYYYQSFVGLDQLLSHIEDIDVIIISSLHFGTTNLPFTPPNQTPYLHLNDNDPNNAIFDQLWCQTEKASAQGCTIMLMLGGAGGAYQALFSDFNTYYPLLVQFIQSKSWIKGIDLDIEEEVSLNDVQMLINHLVQDFGKEFIITMAPISPSLASDGGSMAGFDYKKLYTSNEGKYIHWFNTQCYYSFSYDTYTAIIHNGYPPHKVVMGMESGQFDEKTFSNALNEIKKIKNKYPTCAGVFDWEYLNAPPDKKDPSQWATLIKKN